MTSLNIIMMTRKLTDSVYFMTWVYPSVLIDSYWFYQRTEQNNRFISLKWSIKTKSGVRLKTFIHRYWLANHSRYLMMIKMRTLCQVDINSVWINIIKADKIIDIHDWNHWFPTLLLQIQCFTECNTIRTYINLSYIHKN